MEAARLTATVDANIAPLEAGLKKASGQLDGFASGLTSRIGSVGQALGGALTIGAAAAGAGIAAGLGAGIKAAGDLQQSVANISTIKPSIDTSAVFGALNEISTRVPATASELGDSLYNIFSSFDVGQEQALQLVETFAKGATGAGTSAETFGTSVLGVMNAYGLAAEDATHISDVFFNTVNAGVISGQELASSLGPVTQSAKAAGVSLDELGGLIAGVTKEGGPAAQNVNNLNNFLQKVTTKDAVKEMNALGVATTDQAGNFRPVTEILGDLKGRLEGMTEAGKANALQAIFPDAQARIGAQTLISQLDFVNDAIGTNRDQVGSASSAYEKMSATFNSQSKLLGNTFQSLLTTVGAELLPSITPLVTMFATQLPGAFTTARAAFGSFAGEIGQNSFLAGLQNQVAAFLNIDLSDADNWQAFGLIFQELGTRASEGFQVVKDAFGTIQQVFAGNWSAGLDEAGNSINPLVETIGNLAIVARDQVLPALQAFGSQAGAFLTGTIIPAAQQLAATALPILQQFADWFGTTALPAIQSFATLVQQNLEPIGAVVAGVAAGFATFTILSTIAGWVAAASGAFATLSGVLAGTVALSPAVAGAIAVMTGPLGLVALAVGALAVAWRTNFLGIQDITAGLVSAVTPYVQTIITEVGRFATEMMPLAIAAWQGISTQVTAFMTFISTAIQRDVAAISAFWTTHHATIEAVATRVWQAIEGVISFAWGNVQSTIKTGLELLSGDWQGAWDTMRTSLQKNWDTIKSAVGPAWDAISKAITDKVGEIVSTVTAKAAEIGSGIVNGIRAGFDKAWAGLSGFIQAKIGELPQAIKDLLGIRSPSTVMAEQVGAPMAEGVIAGFVQTLSGGSTAVAEGIRAIVTTAIRHGMDPRVFLALAKAESGLNPSAVGDNGESVGLFQLHARGMGAGMGQSRYDPWVNAERFIGDARVRELYDTMIRGAGVITDAVVSAFGSKAEVSDPQYAGRYGAAYSSLRDIGPSTAGAPATLSGTAALEAALPDPTEWVKNRAAAFKSFYEEVQPPTTLQGALQRMQEAFPELQAMVAEGRDLPNGLDSLAAKMVSLARNTGLNTEAFDRWQAGSLDAQSALEEVVRTAAQADPRFQGLLDSLNVAGASSTTFALDFLNMVAALNEAPTATAAASDAVAAMAGPEMGQQLTATVASIREEFGQIGPVIEQINALLGAGNELAETQRLAVRGIGRGWSRATESLQEYVDLLGQAGGSVALVPAAASDIPEAHTGAYVREGGVAVLDKGETVRTAEQQRGRGGDINITVTGVGMDEVAREVERRLRRAQSMERRGLA